MTPALRHKTDPGIVFIDNDSAARVLHYGEDGLERRPLAGIARERETSLDDIVLRPRECGGPSRSRAARAPLDPQAAPSLPGRTSDP